MTRGFDGRGYRFKHWRLTSLNNILVFGVKHRAITPNIMETVETFILSGD